MWKLYNPNPAGRATEDCTIRAIAKATGKSWDEVYVGTADPISVAISVRGEPLGSATAIYTPATTGAFGNVYVAVPVTVSCGCCVDVGVVNTSTQAITVENANLIVEKEA